MARTGRRELKQMEGLEAVRQETRRETCVPLLFPPFLSSPLPSSPLLFLVKQVCRRSKENDKKRKKN